MTDDEQRLWASVYAAEFARLTARASQPVRPGPDNPRGDWQHGSALDGNAAERQAAMRADTAVTMMRARAEEARR